MMIGALEIQMSDHALFITRLKTDHREGFKKHDKAVDRYGVLHLLCTQRLWIDSNSDDVSGIC